MAKVPTVKIKGHPDYIIINESDYDENEHTLIVEKEQKTSVVEDKVSKAKSTKKAAKSSIDSTIKTE